MNAADDEEISRPSTSNGAASSDNGTVHNDCSKHSNLGSTANGAITKLRTLVCNIPSLDQSDVQKVNNNVTNGSEEKLHNGNSVNSDGECVNGMDSYMRNNVDCHDTVDKCPPKVRDRKEHNNGLGACAYYDSSSGNEEDEECCIYTYKGDHNQMADLPSSFFRLDDVAAPERRQNGSRSSSPEMDFLEMDFDPGPSNDPDFSDDSDCCDMRQDEEGDEESDRQEMAMLAEMAEQLPGANCAEEARNDLNGGSGCEARLSPEPQLPSTPPQMRPSLLVHPTPPTIAGPSHRTVLPPRDSWGHHCSSGDLCSPGDTHTIDSECEPSAALLNAGYLRMQGDTFDSKKYNLHSALYHCIMAKRLVLDKQACFNESDDSNMDGARSPDGLKPIERTMIWSEQEACAKQVTQIGTSACGATAVINVLLALNIPPQIDRVKEGVATRLRAETAPLPEYLFSRSVAGAMHEDLIRALDLTSNGSLYAKFFHMYPNRNVSLSRWLAYWMKKGAIPIVTVNLQAGVPPGSLVPDAWHHQMVFGVGPRGVYLTNPLECVSEAALWPQLSSPSQLCIRRADIISRWNPTTDLRPLMHHPNPAWKKMNVLGQLVNMLREQRDRVVNGSSQENWLPTVNLTQHLIVPSCYSSGVTLALNRESPAFHELSTTPQLPLAPPL